MHQKPRSSLMWQHDPTHGLVVASCCVRLPVPPNVRSETMEKTNESRAVPKQATRLSSTRQYHGQVIFPVIVWSCRTILLAIKNNEPSHSGFVHHHPVCRPVCIRRSIEIVSVQFVHEPLDVVVSSMTMLFGVLLMSI